jgi:ribosomal 50S subunit-associated protein YjgA (DUF615 family)
MSDAFERLREIVRNYVKAEDEYLNAYPETDTSQLKKKVDEAWKALRNEVA